MRDTFPGRHSHTCLQTSAIVFHSCKMAPTKRTSLTWKDNVVILDKLKLLEHGTSQRSAAEQLDIIGFGCFHNTVGISRMNWAPPVLSSSRLYQPLWSGPGVDDITGFYCTLFFFYLKRNGRLIEGGEERRRRHVVAHEGPHVLEQDVHLLSTKNYTSSPASSARFGTRS